MTIWAELLSLLVQRMAGVQPQGESLGDGVSQVDKLPQDRGSPKLLHAMLGGCWRECQSSGTFDLPCVGKVIC